MKKITLNEIGLIVSLLFALVTGILFAVLIGRWQNNFRKELRYLRIEIERTEGREREYWIQKKRRLWLSLLPFVRY